MGGDGEESSADVVSADWVRLMATFADTDIEPLVSALTKALVEEYSDLKIAPADDMRQALRELVTLCREATQRGLPVVRTWSL